MKTYYIVAEVEVFKRGDRQDVYQILELGSDGIYYRRRDPDDEDYDLKEEALEECARLRAAKGL